jgi:hypothetical protein
MGMTNGQFKSYIRLLLSDIKEASEEKDEEKKARKLAEILSNLQSALEE